MSKWCETCYRNELTGKWESCNENCPVFGKYFADLAKIEIERDIKRKQHDAEWGEYNEDNCVDESFNEFASKFVFMNIVRRWLKNFLEIHGKTSVDELTIEEIEAEIYDLQTSINNEQKYELPDIVHINNLNEYMDELTTILDRKKEQKNERRT